VKQPLKIEKGWKSQEDFENHYECSTCNCNIKTCNRNSFVAWINKRNVDNRCATVWKSRCFSVVYGRLQTNLCNSKYHEAVALELKDEEELRLVGVGRFQTRLPLNKPEYSDV
jgi:hypothetical protein